MESWLTLGALALASAVNSAIPGPCVALTIARASRGGLGAGLAVTGGILAADLALATLALAVLLGLLEISAELVSGLRWPAACLMIAMGLRMLLQSLPAGPRPTHPAVRAAPATSAPACWSASPAPTTWCSSWRCCRSTSGPRRLTGPMVPLVAAALLAGAAAAYLGAVAIGAGSCRLARRRPRSGSRPPGPSA